MHKKDYTKGMQGDYVRVYKDLRKVLPQIAGNRRKFAVQEVAPPAPSERLCSLDGRPFALERWHLNLAVLKLMMLPVEIATRHSWPAPVRPQPHKATLAHTSHALLPQDSHQITMPYDAFLHLAYESLYKL